MLHVNNIQMKFENNLCEAKIDVNKIQLYVEKYIGVRNFVVGGNVNKI